MYLYLLEPTDAVLVSIRRGYDAWAEAMVIAANSEPEARQKAVTLALDEGPEYALLRVNHELETGRNLLSDLRGPYDRAQLAPPEWN